MKKSDVAAAATRAFGPGVRVLRAPGAFRWQVTTVRGTVLARARTLDGLLAEIRSWRRPPSTSTVGA